MRKLIYADALHKAFYTKQKWVVHKDGKDNDGYTSDQVHFTIDEQPAVEVVPVKRGDWLNYCPDTCICSECTFIIPEWFVSKFIYCPHCGARMEE